MFRKSLRLYIILLAKFAGPCFGVLLYLTVLYVTLPIRDWTAPYAVIGLLPMC